MATNPLTPADGPVVLRNFQHASRIFIDANYRLSPKYGFLFYVQFDLNPSVTQLTSDSRKQLGLVVKSASLPKFTVDTKIQNAYNRKNVVQQKINYDPVSITFHDDQNDVIRSFWYDYYSFFYRDSDYSDELYSQRSKYTARPVPDWGYSPRPVKSTTSGYKAQEYQYIQAITIYSMYQRNFSAYQLVNPTILSFKHGDHDNAQNEIMHHEMSVSYEAVKYKTGYVTEGAAGWLELYDHVPSPNGGVIDNLSSEVKDLADNNIHPGEMANNPLSTLAGFGAGLAGELLGGLTAGIGGLVGNLLSDGISSLTKKFDIPSPGSLVDKLTDKVSSASQSLQTEIAGMSSSVEDALGLGQKTKEASTAVTPSAPAAVGGDEGE